eukprot:3937725-Rhodomonas_salina.1
MNINSTILLPLFHTFTPRAFTWCSVLHLTSHILSFVHTHPPNRTKSMKHWQDEHAKARGGIHKHTHTAAHMHYEGLGLERGLTPRAAETLP